MRSKAKRRERSVVDLHTHILPQMDDGSRSMKMSLTMLERLAGQGVTDVCLTPHYYSWKESIPLFCDRRQEALRQLKSGLPDGMPELILGAEVAWFPNISAQNLTPFCLEGTRTLLLEMPFMQWTQQEVDEAISLVLDRGYQVIFVHPERFCIKGTANRNYLEKLARLPVGFQINAETLAHWYTRRQGLELLCRAQYPLLGSDCHDLTRRPPYMGQARQVIQQKLGLDFLEQVDRNARAAIQGTEWSI